MTESCTNFEFKDTNWQVGFSEQKFKNILLRLEMIMAVGLGAVVITFLSTDGLEILTDMRRHGNRCY